MQKHLSLTVPYFEKLKHGKLLVGAVLAIGVIFLCTSFLFIAFQDKVISIYSESSNLFVRFPGPKEALSTISPDSFRYKKFESLYAFNDTLFLVFLFLIVASTLVSYSVSVSLVKRNIDLTKENVVAAAKGIGFCVIFWLATYFLLRSLIFSEPPLTNQGFSRHSLLSTLILVMFFTSLMLFLGALQGKFKKESN